VYRSAEVRIERLAVRLRGVPAPIARAAAVGVGSELMEQLALQLVPAKHTGRTDRPLLAVGIVRVQTPAREAAVRDAIVSTVASSIEKAWHGERSG
jgi:hypothetical protein